LKTKHEQKQIDAQDLFGGNNKAAIVVASFQVLVPNDNFDILLLVSKFNEFVLLLCYCYCLLYRNMMFHQLYISQKFPLSSLVIIKQSSAKRTTCETLAHR
jgi:hypothetical protein